MVSASLEIIGLEGENREIRITKNGLFFKILAFQESVETRIVKGWRFDKIGRADCLEVTTIIGIIFRQGVDGSASFSKQC